MLHNVGTLLVELIKSECAKFLVFTYLFSFKLSVKEKYKLI